MSLYPLPAYVGPGPGLTMLWAFIALLGTICLSVLYLLSWPLRLILRRVRGSAADDRTAAGADGSPDTPVSAGVERE